MEKLKEIRTSNNLTYKEMALKLGISKPFYWQIENGERGLYYKTAIKIAEIFNMRPDDIFYEEFKNKD